MNVPGTRTLDISGRRFGKLIAMRLADEPSRNGPRRWVCKCDCGETTLAEGRKLLSGKRVSCGHRKSVRERIKTTPRYLKYEIITAGHIAMSLGIDVLSVRPVLADMVTYGELEIVSSRRRDGEPVNTYRRVRKQKFIMLVKSPRKLGFNQWAR